MTTSIKVRLNKSNGWTNRNKKLEIRSTRTAIAQLSKITYNSKAPGTDTGHFHSCNHQKWLPYQIIGDKTVKNVN